ncbi:MAG: CopG family transcriptional regulator [Deltaproteobacteria bacterium]|nr:MAG: CopG family transcriptional regulator [Deltaproteobacteria bacterium]
MAEDFDYEEYSRTHPPDPAKVRRGRAAREERRSGTKQRITIRLDEDILEAFKGMAPDGHGYQALINKALREWLAARDVKELIRDDLREILRTAIQEGRDQAAGHH